MMTLEGFSMLEIAGLRATRTGAVKAQCASVYAGAGVSGRSRLLSLFVDQLMGDPLPRAAPPER